MGVTSCTTVAQWLRQNWNSALTDREVDAVADKQANALLDFQLEERKREMDDTRQRNAEFGRLLKVLVPELGFGSPSKEDTQRRHAKIDAALEKRDAYLSGADLREAD